MPDFYVADGAENASDEYLVGTITRPWKTLERALDYIRKQVAANSRNGFDGGIQFDTTIHLGSGAYAWTSTLGPFALGANIFIIGDGAGQAGDDGFTVLRATAAATGGSTSAAQTSGLVTDAYRGKTIEIVTGAAAGDRRTIRNNTDTTIVPCATFSAAIQSGDTFRIVEPAVEFQAASPTTPFTTLDAVSIDGCGARGGFPGAEWRNGLPGWSVYLINLRLAAAPAASFAFTGWTFYGSSVVFCGVEFVERTNQFFSFQSCSRSTVQAGVDWCGTGRQLRGPIAAGLVSRGTAWIGWGLSQPESSASAVVALTDFHGFIVTSTTEITGRWNILGGSFYDTVAGSSTLVVRGGVATIGAWLASSTVTPVLIVHRANTDARLSALVATGGGIANVAHARIEKTNIGTAVQAVGTGDHQGTTPGFVSLSGDTGLVNVVGITDDDPPSYGLVVRGGGRIAFLDEYFTISGTFASGTQMAAFSARIDGTPDAAQDYTDFLADGDSISSDDGSVIQRM